MKADTRSVIHEAGRDRDGFIVDSLDRRQPTPMNILWLARAVPGLLEQFNRVVPDNFWSRDADEDGVPVAAIACPCGEEPRPRLGHTAECECGRFYLNLGERVRVANSPKDQPQEATGS